MLLLSTRLMIIASNYLVQGYYEKVKITAPYIAEKCNINPRALKPALRRLTQVGILRSQVGGKEPGFILARDPSIISIFDIIDALEQDMHVNSCRELNMSINCEIKNCEDCSMYKTINIGLSRITDNLKKVTLLDHYESGVQSEVVKTAK